MQIIKKMYEFGEYIGVAFQMKDDLFDYENNLTIGKPVGIDIKEQKMTLPIIYTLNHVNQNEKNFIINVIKNHNTNEKKVAKVINVVRKNNGIEYTKQKMIKYKERALEVLKEFKNNEAKRSLKLLVNHVIEREK